MNWRNIVAIGLGAVCIALFAWLRPTAASPPQADTTRFDFEIVECYDAMYLGDTPGHIGRGGGLGAHAPDLALGDPVYHGNTRIGQVSRLVWDRAKASLQVEISPEPKIRISVGQSVWVPIGGEAAAKVKR